MFCSGCFYRGIFYVLSRLKDVIIIGDIGCYILGVLFFFNVMDSCVCMGVSIGMVYGILNVLDKK